MKRYFFLFSAFLCAVLLSSCDKKAEKSIVGKWKVVSATSIDIDDIFLDKGKVWNFNDNGTCSVTLSGERYSTRYVCDGNTLKIQGGDFELFDDDYVDKYVFDYYIDELSESNFSISGSAKYIASENGQIYDEDNAHLSYGLIKAN